MQENFNNLSQVTALVTSNRSIKKLLIFYILLVAALSIVFHYSALPEILSPSLRRLMESGQFPALITMRFKDSEEFRSGYGASYLLTLFSAFIIGPLLCACYVVLALRIEELRHAKYMVQSSDIRKYLSISFGWVLLLIVCFLLPLGMREGRPSGLRIFLVGPPQTVLSLVWIAGLIVVIWIPILMIVVNRNANRS